MSTADAILRISKVTNKCEQLIRRLGSEVKLTSDQIPNFYMRVKPCGDVFIKRPQDRDEYHVYSADGLVHYEAIYNLAEKMELLLDEALKTEK